MTRPPIGDIREALPTERASIVALIRAVWADRVDPRSSGQRFTLADLDRLIEVEGATTLVAVSVDEEVVGTVTVVPNSGDSDSGSHELTKLAVAATHAGSGVADALMEAVHGRWSHLLLAVSAFQPDLVRYYARFGYAVDPSSTYAHASPLSPTPIVMTRPGPEHDVIAEAVATLTDGRLVGMPTETVYGLAADATDPLAVRSVFARKGRPVDHPLIVHLCSAAHLDAWAEVTDEASRLAAVFWPGPLTLVLPRQPHVLDEVTGGRDTVALRVPNHPLALAMIAMIGRSAGVVAPSANRFGGVSPTTADHVRADGLADYVLDGGACQVGVESTIVELIDGRAQILRPGAITAEQIEAVINRRIETEPTGPSRAPGMMASHYAPRAAVLVVRVNDAPTWRPGETDWTSIGYLGPEGSAPPGTTAVPTVHPYSSENVARVLFARLREADEQGLDLLLVAEPTDGALVSAVRDRLHRAAAPRSA